MTGGAARDLWRSDQAFLKCLAVTSPEEGGESVWGRGCLRRGFLWRGCLWRGCWAREKERRFTSQKIHVSEPKQAQGRSQVPCGMDVWMSLWS
eukprot:357792-Chlamydomonas_euryale.AAC.4